MFIIFISQCCLAKKHFNAVVGIRYPVFGYPDSDSDSDCFGNQIFGIGIRIDIRFPIRIVIRIFGFRSGSQSGSPLCPKIEKVGLCFDKLPGLFIFLMKRTWDFEIRPISRLAIFLPNIDRNRAGRKMCYKKNWKYEIHRSRASWHLKRWKFIFYTVFL